MEASKTAHHREDKQTKKAQKSPFSFFFMSYRHIAIWKLEAGILIVFLLTNKKDSKFYNKMKRLPGPKKKLCLLHGQKLNEYLYKQLLNDWQSLQSFL